jgi:RNA 3'-terminal phosphate cyclase (ATP)
MISEIESRSTLDVHAFDQFLPYMVLAKENGSSSCIVREVTNHASTNMWLLKQFFDADFEAIQSDDNIKIVVR